MRYCWPNCYDKFVDNRPHTQNFSYFFLLNLVKVKVKTEQEKKKKTLHLINETQIYVLFAKHQPQTIVRYYKLQSSKIFTKSVGS